MYYFSNKFYLLLKRSLTFNIGDLKFRNLAKYWFMKLIITKSNFKI